MDITLKYTFERRGVCMDSNQPYGVLEPRTHMGSYEETYDYQADITYNLVLDYMISLIGKRTFDKWTYEKQQGFISCFDLLWQEEVFNEDYFLMSESFYNFAWAYYEEQAKEEFDVFND